MDRPTPPAGSPRPSRSRARGAIAFAACIATSLAGAPALAQSSGWSPPPYPTFPHSTSFASIKLWILGDTDLALDHVIMLNTEAVYAFVDDGPPTGGGTVSRVVREEAINGALAQRLGGRSATAEVTFDCDHAETTVSAVTLYPGNSLGGGPGQPTPATRWLDANPGLDLTDLSQAACSAAYQRPFKASVRSAALRGPASAPRPTLPRPIPNEPVPAEPSEPQVPRPGHVWAQVGAFGSAALADDHWRKLKDHYPTDTDGLTLRDETVARDGKTLHRALAGPFETRATAEAFCMRVRNGGGDCLVR